MPKSRKRHHSRSRSRSHSRERSHDRDDKYKKNDSYDKERDGKRRKIESCDSPTTRKSVSEEQELGQSQPNLQKEDLETPSKSIEQSEELIVENDEKLENKVDESYSNIVSIQKEETSLVTVGNDAATKLISESNTQSDDSSRNSATDPVLNDGHKNITNGDEAVSVIEVDNDEETATPKRPEEKIVLSEQVHSFINVEESNKTEECLLASVQKSSDADEFEEVMDVDEDSNKNTVAGSSDECINVTGNNEATSKLDESVDLIEIDNDEKTDSGKQTKEKLASSTQGSTVHKHKLDVTPTKYVSPKQLQKKLESEKKRMERQKEKEEKERQRNEERVRVLKEKQKKKEEKQREIEQKQKEKELKDEQKRREREEKELKRKEKEEKDEQKRLEKELGKQREEEKKQKAAAAFVNFFVAKKPDAQPDEKKIEEPQRSSVFMAFEVKSDMKLPPLRRQILSDEQKEILDNYLTVQDGKSSYLKELRSRTNIGKSPKTWPYEDFDDDIEIVDEESGDVGEVINEEIKPTKLRAKFLKFHENRRPAYFGTWRKKSNFITPRRPLAEDVDTFNYEEDSDDDWEEEEQGESLNGSDDEDDKENEGEKNEYELDNEVFVPHGHLSDDEVDDEENARMSPETLKLKLKLLNDEFEQEKNSKTHRLKPKAIGCIWYKKDGGNVDEAIHNYLKPLAVICRGPVEIRNRGNIFTAHKVKNKKQLNPDVIPLFLKFIHGSEERKKHVFEKFRIYMLENGNKLEFSKRSLLACLNENASLKKVESGSNKNKVCWIVNPEVREKYNVDVGVLNVESDS